MPLSKAASSISPAESEAWRTPSIIAVNVLRVKRSAMWGRLPFGVDEAGRDPDVLEAGFDKERVEPAADEGVASRVFLNLDEAVDHGVGGRVVWMEEGRAGVAFDDGEGASGADDSAQGGQGVDGPAQVLEQEAHEDVVERGRGEGQVEHVGRAELDVDDPGPSQPLGGGRQRLL